MSLTYYEKYLHIKQFKNFVIFRPFSFSSFTVFQTQTRIGKG